MPQYIYVSIFQFTTHQLQFIVFGYYLYMLYMYLFVLCLQLQNIMFSILRKKKKQELTFYLKLDQNLPPQIATKPHTSHNKSTTRIQKRSVKKLTEAELKKQQHQRHPLSVHRQLRQQSQKKAVNLLNIQRLTKLYKARVEENRHHIQEFSTDYLLNRIKIVGLFRSGNFGNVYRAILNNNSNCMEVAVKKVQIDADHISREEYFTKILKSSYIVEYIGTYYTSQSQQIGDTQLENNEQLLTDTKINTHHRSKNKQQSQNQRYLNIVMKKYGNNLDEIIKLQTIEPSRMKILIYQMIRALIYIHALNICHRDIKPHNFVTKNNRIFLCDFGASKIMNQKQKSVSYIFSREYRAPQLLFDYDKYDKSVDIWALGCVIAEMVLRKPLFKGSNNLDQLIKILKVLGSPKWQIISFSRNRNPKIPQIEGIDLKQIFNQKCDPLLIKLISRMLKIQPKERVSAIQALCDPYFDDIRDQSFYRIHLRGTNLPNFFHFTRRQFFGKQQYLNKLIPFWIKEYCKRFQISIKDYNF